MRIRKLRSGITSAALVLAVGLLILPAMAAADHDGRRERIEQRSDHRREQTRHRHNAHRSYRGAWSFDRLIARTAYRRQDVGRAAHRRHHHRPSIEDRPAAPYYCEPCRHHFTSRNGFHRHLLYHHRVAAWRLSRAIVHHAFGWVFYG